MKKEIEKAFTDKRIGSVTEKHESGIIVFKSYVHLPWEDWYGILEHLFGRYFVNHSQSTSKEKVLEPIGCYVLRSIVKTDMQWIKKQAGPLVLMYLDFSRSIDTSFMSERSPDEDMTWGLDRLYGVVPEMEEKYKEAFNLNNNPRLSGLDIDLF